MVEINAIDSLGPSDMEMYIFEKLGHPAQFLSDAGFNSKEGLPKLITNSARINIINSAMKAKYRKDFVEHFFQSIPLFEAKFLSLAMSYAPTLEHGFREVVNLCAHPSQWLKAEFTFEADKAVLTLCPRIELGHAALPVVEGAIRHLAKHVFVHQDARANEIFAYVSHEYDPECSTRLPFRVLYGQPRIAIELPAKLAKSKSTFFDADLWPLIQSRNQRQIEESDLYNRLGIIEVELTQFWASNGRLPRIKEFAELRGQSPRSLMRTLRAQGLQFKVLTDRLQAERAAELLCSGHLTIESIAEILGFADSSSFRRSFRRWYKINPRDWRNHEAFNTLLSAPVYSPLGLGPAQMTPNDAGVRE